MSLKISTTKIIHKVDKTTKADKFNTKNTYKRAHKTREVSAPKQRQMSKNTKSIITHKKFPHLLLETKAKQPV